MEKAIVQILDRLRHGDLDAGDLDKLLRDLDAAERNAKRRYVKKCLMPYYLRVKRDDPHRFASWHVDDELESRLVRLIQVKPRRTASGVATITVITRPWPCGNACLYCPNDIRMPKSYLHAEPACQRAERNFFDPYMQVAARLRTLHEMGHPTDKVELIVLGGSWTDYPESYRIWFVTELFRALNDTPEARAKRVGELEEFYASNCSDHASVSLGPGAAGDGGLAGVPVGAGLCPPADGDVQISLGGRAWAHPYEGHCAESFLAALQVRVDAGELSYNEAIRMLYGDALPPLPGIGVACKVTLAKQQRINEGAACRNVGLVVETRPTALSFSCLRELRELGCTKVQVGVQTLDEGLMRANRRPGSREALAASFDMLRAFGFKIHAHFMVNLFGSTPEHDIVDFRDFACSPEFQPDEIKLYPCALIGGTAFEREYAAGNWEPYDEEMLVRVLCADVVATQPFCRISRMIRDFSAGDIVAGSKKTNLRQLVEKRLREGGEAVEEIRFREIGEGEVDLDSLRLAEYPYDTQATREVFLQWVTPENKIAGFLRLSLPRPEYLCAHAAELPVHENEAMIREVHVYGRAAQIHKENGSAQHTGLGRRLIERACELARSEGYEKLSVISAVGTRAYYRRLGFVDCGLYQQRTL